MKRQIVTTVLLVNLAALLAVAPTTFAAGPNLLANPGFEDAGGSFNGWFTFGSGVQLSLPAGDNVIRTGAAASKVFGEFTMCPGPGKFTVGGYGQAFAFPFAGDDYRFDGFYFVSAADPIPGSNPCTGNRAVAKIAFFDAASGGAELSSNEIIIGDGNSKLNTWVGFSVSAPVPTGALRVEALILFLQPACATGAVYVDDLNFCVSTPAAEANLLANPSFSTGLTGWSTFGNVFTEARAVAVRTPSGSAKMFSTFTAESPSGMFQSIAATPGSSWKFDVWTRSFCEDPVNGSNDNFMSAKIVFRDGLAAEIGANETVIQTADSPVGTWTRHTLIATAPGGTVTVEPYVLFISPSLLGGSIWVDDASFRQIATTDVPITERRPGLELHQNSPNPFSPATRISFELESRGTVDLSIYDVAGRRIRNLIQGEVGVGSHTVVWDGTTENGIRAAVGVYRYVLRTPTDRMSRSMLLIR